MLILGAGYLGAVLAELALARGEDVMLADNWYATDREQLNGLAAAGARVETADIRKRSDLDDLLAQRPSRVYLLAAQASRPLAERDPDYTEETNLTGARRVAQALGEAAGPPLVYASSLNVYGAPSGRVGTDHPYGSQRDLAHLSKIYAELCCQLFARRHGFALGIHRLGILYGPSPVEHEAPESQTVVDRFRRLAAAGEALPLDDGGRATIGVAHVEDAARIMLDEIPEAGIAIENVVAESLTVASLAALAHGKEPEGERTATYASRLVYRHRVADYLRR